MVTDDCVSLYLMVHSQQQHHEHDQTPKPTAHDHLKEADNHAGHDKHPNLKHLIL